MIVSHALSPLKGIIALTVLLSTPLCWGLTAQAQENQTQSAQTSTPLPEQSQPEATNIAQESSNDKSQIKILSPSNNLTLQTPATPIVVQSPLSEEIQLKVNGRIVDPLLIGRTEKDTAQGIKTQTWYGVVFEGGSNVLEVFTPGQEQAADTITVLVPKEPTQIRVSSVESRIPADGQSLATIEGELIDDDGLPSPWDIEVTLATTAGEFVGIDANPDAPGFQVKTEQGQFSAQLKSGVEAGVVRIRANSSQFEGYHQMQFDTALRKEPLFTGTVDVRLGRRGTNFFDDFEDFLPTDKEYGFQVDAKAKAFGNAAIGEWSITGEIDSERSLNRDCERKSSLFRAAGEECDREFYPTYGDDSTSIFTAPSKDHVYLKLERSPRAENSSPDYFMWGDYNTQEFSRSSQQYSGIGRSFHGFKGNYNVGRLQLTGLYGKDVDGFQRDVIAPDGTRGDYFLSRRSLLPGSENVFIELEELNRPGTVIERIEMVPGADYQVDYDQGSIFFERPVLKTDIAPDGQILVRKIVVTYQFEGEVNPTNVVGGRVQYHFSRDPDTASWAGATYFREDRGAQDFELYGADAQIQLGKNAKIIAEYAHSMNDLEVETPIEGDAFRAEFQGSLFDDKLKSKAYWRTTDEGFSNNATTSFVPGQTRYGGELEADITSKTALRFSYDHEDNFGVAPARLDALEDLLAPGFAPQPGAPVDNELTTIKAGIKQEIGKADLTVDWVHRDRNDDIRDTRIVTDQLSSVFKMPITQKLGFHTYSDITLSNETDPIYPTRLTAGLDWQIHPNVTLGLNQSYLDGGRYDNDWLTTLDIDAQHKFKTGTTLRSTTSLLGTRGMAGSVGVDQGIKLAKGLNLDLSYEHLFKMPFQSTAAGEQFLQPYAVGQGGSALSTNPGHNFSAGLSYRTNDDFQAKARVDYRTASSRTNLVFTSNLLGKINKNWTGVSNVKWASAANQKLEALGDSIDLKVGLAYRNPDHDKFNGLIRYEFRQNPSIIPETLLLGKGTGSQEHLFAAEGIYSPHWRWELYGKAGIRHSRTHLAEDLIGSSTVSLGQLRLTHRFDYRWDVAGEIRAISQANTRYREIGANVEVGYYLNPNLRLAAGYAFGDIHDPDLGNSRSSSGPYLGFTIKLDNNLLKDFGFANNKRPKAEDLPTFPTQLPPTTTQNPQQTLPQSMTPQAEETQDTPRRSPTRDKPLQTPPPQQRQAP